MSSRPQVVIDIVGEGKTDVPQDDKPHAPNDGVLPILVHKLCGQPQSMLVRSRQISFLFRKKSLSQKVSFARRQARYSGSMGIVVVIDSDGDWEGRYEQLKKGRDVDQDPDFPTALGVAHPCIEAWLLSDPAAIRKAFHLSGTPSVPEDPEKLPAADSDTSHPKNVLKDAAGKTRRLSAQEKTEIAKNLSDLDLLRKQCPISFAPFADEVQKHLRPLFA